MARIQILELPEGSSDDRPPFVLVVDQWTNPFRGYPTEWAATVGAQGVLVFEDTIDIPANDVPVDEDGHPLFLKVHVEGEFEKFHEQFQQEVLAAQGQVTRALREADPVRERTDIARDMDRLAKWKTELADALRIYRSSSWNDIRNTIEALRNERDDQAAKVERILRLSETPQQGAGVETDDYLHGYRDAIRWALAALTGPVDAQSTPDA